MTPYEFDGISFDSLYGLVAFLKHSYHAHKSQIKTLEAELETARKDSNQERQIKENWLSVLQFNEWD